MYNTILLQTKNKQIYKKGMSAIFIISKDNV